MIVPIRQLFLANIIYSHINNKNTEYLCKSDNDCNYLGSNYKCLLLDNNVLSNTVIYQCINNYRELKNKQSDDNSHGGSNHGSNDSSHNSSHHGSNVGSDDSSHHGSNEGSDDSSHNSSHHGSNNISSNNNTTDDISKSSSNLKKSDCTNKYLSTLLLLNIYIFIYNYM
jgi:hypothetical protein